MFYVILLYAISAFTFVFSKYLLTFLSPIFLTGLRTFFAGSILLIYLKTRKNSGSLKKYIIACIPIAMCSFFLANSLKFWSLQFINVSNAALISISEPIFAVIITYLLFSEKINFKQFFGLTICIIGSTSLVFTQQGKLFNLNSLISFQSLILIMSVAISAFGAILLRKQLLKNNSNVLLINGISMFIGGLCALFASYNLEEIKFDISTNNFIYVFLTLGLIIFISNIFAYNLYGSLIKKYSILFISCASFTRPLFIDLYNFILNYKTPSINSLLAGLIIFLGISILYKEEKQYILQKNFTKV